MATIRNLEFSASLDAKYIPTQHTVTPEDVTQDHGAPDIDTPNINAPDSVAREMFVMGDETLLRRLADILLDNAFKYTPSPGSVHLALGMNGESAVITVQDSGVGIAEEDQGKIFDRFYRVDKARSRAQGGAGLGLAIAQWIVTQHRGSITVESRPGQGTTFRVELPMTAAPVSNPLPA
jgi:signal transduction histidine kinase